MLRLQNDANYRESQKVPGWTEDDCRYLDYLTTIDISHSATWHQRNQYGNTILLLSNDDKHAGRMRARKDFKSTTQNLAALQREYGRQNAQIPRNERARPRPCDEALRVDLEWHSQNCKSHWSQTSFVIFTTKVATRTPRHSMARSTSVERVMTTDSFKAT